MKATEHPEYTIEQAHLSSIQKAIKVFLGTANPHLVKFDRIWEAYGGADEHTARVFHGQHVAKWNKFSKLNRDPYFGRFDFQEGSSPAETFYVGYEGFEINGTSITDWRAPIATLFYRSSPPKPDAISSYISWGGAVNGYLLLKRNIRVDNEILEISDEYDWRLNTTGKAKTENREAIVAEEIAKRGDPRLQDIVKTIQEEQDVIIRKPQKSIQVINGVAGSGKTSIAYHRVAFLLYQGKEGNQTPLRTIIFGPNRLFMSYVKDLLPSLGVQMVEQTTFEDWAFGQMGYLLKDQNRAFKVVDTSAAAFTQPGISTQKKQEHWRRSRLKGSEKFKTLISRYIDHLKKKVEYPPTGFSLTLNINGIDLTISIRYEQIQKAVQGIDIENTLYADYRATVLTRLSRLIDTSYDSAVAICIAQLTLNVRDDDDKIKDVDNKRNFLISNKRKYVSEFQTQLQKEFELFWPSINLRRDYNNLLENQPLLSQLASGLFTKEEIILLSNLKLPEDSVDLEDVPGLLFFYISSFGNRLQPYDHIVVDEAQDFSPLQFEILRLFNPENSMTIVGDIQQRIYANRGLQSWSDLKAVFSAIDENYIVQNYRSTAEIVEFTNGILLSNSNKNNILAKPFNRHGKRPKILTAVSDRVMLDRLASDVSMFLQQGYSNIAVIAKTREQSEDIYSYLKPRFAAKVNNLNSRDGVYNFNNSVSIIPVGLAKGLEFEIVLVPNVEEANYRTDTPYDHQLMYVAATRALHQLYLYAVNSVSKILTNALEKADIIAL